MDILIDFFLRLSEQLGYGGVFILMTVESSFIPFPSEIVIPPAAYLASQGQMNIYLVILFGVAGSIVGAVINYFLAFHLGRGIICKVANTRMCRMLLINPTKIEQSEKFFLKYGSVATLTGRLVPVVRQLISLPAGFAKMNFTKFVIFTTIGSATWVIVLAILGYVFGANQEVLVRYYKVISLLFILIVFMVISFIAIRRFNNYKKKKM